MNDDKMFRSADYVVNNKNRMLFVETIAPRGPGLHPCVVMGHGYGGHHRRPYMETVKEICHSLDIGTVAFDLTGCGRSDGDLGMLTPKVAKNDWETVVNYAARLPWVDDHQMMGFGTSFSANALLQFAADDQENHLGQGLILHVPVPKWKKIVEFALQAQLMLKGKNLKKMSEDASVPVVLGEDLEIHVSQKLLDQLREMNLYKDAAPNIHQPVTIIGGEKDALVAPEKLLKLKQSFPEDTKTRLEIIKKAGHGFNAQQLECLGGIVRETLEQAFGERALPHDQHQYFGYQEPVLRAI